MTLIEKASILILILSIFSLQHLQLVAGIVLNVQFRILGCLLVTRTFWRCTIFLRYSVFCVFSYLRSLSPNVALPTEWKTENFILNLFLIVFFSVLVDVVIVYFWAENERKIEVTGVNWSVSDLLSPRLCFTQLSWIQAK